MSVRMDGHIQEYGGQAAGFCRFHWEVAPGGQSPERWEAAGKRSKRSSSAGPDFRARTGIKGSERGVFLLWGKKDIMQTHAQLGPSVNVGMQLPLVKHTHPTDRLVQELYCGLELVVP